MELRSDVAAAAEKMVGGARVTRELDELATHLRRCERVRRLCTGAYPAGYGLMAVTNLRVILLRGGERGGSGGFVLRRLSSVDWAPGLLAGTITITDPAGCTELRNVELGEGEEIVRFIRTRMRVWSLVKAPHTLLNRVKPEDRSVGEIPTGRHALVRRPADEPVTEVLERVGDQPPRSPVWPVAAAAGLIAASGLGFYQLIPDDSAPAEPAGAPAPAATTSPPAGTGGINPVVGVVKVIDADSLEVAGGAGGPVEVLGIVAPEAGQCGADAAMRFATTKLLGMPVTLVPDPSQPWEDPQGRILAHVKLPNGMDYAVLASGAGVVKYHESDPPVERADEIKAAEAEAQQASKGVWGSPCHGNFTDGPTPQAE